MNEKEIEMTFTLIEAKGGKSAKVLGLAYSGGAIDLGWDAPVVVDLAGMQIAETIPLLANHENKTTARIGTIRAAVKNGTLEIEGEITSETFIASDIVTQGKSGGEWQLSIGATIKVSREVAESEEVVANGRTFQGPILLATQTVLREVSVVAVGADENTHMSIAASWRLENEKQDREPTIEAAQELGQEEKEDEVMTPEEIKAMHEKEKQSTIEAMRAEQNRIAEINAACKDHPEIQAKAIDEGLSVTEAKAMILDAMEARQGSEINASYINTGGTATGAEVVEAALALSTGAVSKPEKHYSEQTLDAANKIRGIGICEAIKMLCAQEGTRVEAGASPMILATSGFSTVSLPNMLGNIANKTLADAYSSRPSTVDVLFEALSVSNFHEHTGVRLGGLGRMEKVQNGGPIKHTTMAEETFTYRVNTIGRLVGLTREMLKNDDLGGFVRLIQNLGISAANTKEREAWELVLANTGNFFHGDNSNLIVDALDIDGISEALEALVLQTGIDGEPISIDATWLVVPPQLNATARQIYASDKVKGNTDEPDANIYRNAYLPVMVPYLGNSAVTGNSATAWYLWSADVRPFGIAYLDGVRAPQIEEVDPGAEYLGRAWRAYMDYGVCQIDPRGAVKSTGAGS